MKAIEEYRLNNKRYPTIYVSAKYHKQMEGLLRGISKWMPIEVEIDDNVDRWELGRNFSEKV
ncbi:hypothetical protein [Fodinibius sediminis]|uniref:Uncharacterized protein n=1 Tax=Fodinibius sediminis TaxID=1214077 RepID=A0A521AVS6_9BACT|nr:hypothetical protein [Fodinibius sediminis]SMO38938.1 hypothetical protein SAMN06265218_101422 [Fodinibius sediminis]